MAVEAPHMTNLFPPLSIKNRDVIRAQVNMNNRMDLGLLMNATTPDGFFPYGQSFMCDPISSLNKAESGLTHNVNASPRKRPRDSTAAESDAFFAAAQKRRASGGFPTLMDPDVICQIQQQQMEMDRFVAQHTEKLRFDVEERRRTQSRMLTSAIQSAIAKKLKEKDDEIQRIGKLNYVLQERVKSLFVENQIWRDLAQTNEAAANSLRTNLEHVLAAARQPSPLTAEEAESSCGSCVGAGKDAGDEINSAGDRRRKAAEVVCRGCRRCGEKEASVLLLPCRHLCLCTVCGSSLQRACPVCDTVTSGSVHVNMS